MGFYSQGAIEVIALHPCSQMPIIQRPDRLPWEDIQPHLGGIGVQVEQDEQHPDDKDEAGTDYAHGLASAHGNSVE